METTTTAPYRFSILFTLRQLSPSAQLYLILFMLVLGALAVGLGIYSVTDTSSPIDNTAPSVLIHTSFTA